MIYKGEMNGHQVTVVMRTAHDAAANLYRSRADVLTQDGAPPYCSIHFAPAYPTAGEAFEFGCYSMKNLGFKLNPGG